MNADEDFGSPRTVLIFLVGFMACGGGGVATLSLKRWNLGNGETLFEPALLVFYAYDAW